MLCQRWIWIWLGALACCCSCSKIVPPLYRYDDHVKCAREGRTGEYCFVKVVFEVDRDPFDSPKIVTDFRRNLLDWGVCVSDCQQEVASIGVRDRKGLVIKPVINHTYIYPSNLWDYDQDSFKGRYNELINMCVNSRLRRNYKFDRLAYTEIEYCTSKELRHKTRSPDWSMNLFYAIVQVLIGLLIGANVIDWLGHNQLKEHILVSAFSIRRNWYRMTEEPASELHRDFGYIDGLRVIMSLFVMSIHYLLIVGMIPLSNVEYVEQVLHGTFMIDFGTTCTLAVQIFFAISGLLLTATVLEDFKHEPQIRVRYFWDKIRNRIIRIVPVYFFFLLLSIVVADFPGVVVGPIGYKTLIQEQARCRKNWWTNVLFVNNLPALGQDRCNAQGWYLAADLQLFLVALLLLAAIWMYSKRAKTIVWTVMIVALAIPAGIVYFYELESALPIRLSDLQYQFMYQPWFNHVYMPGYSNLNSYMAGVVVGYLYHQHKHNKLNISNSKLYKTTKKLRLPLLALTYLPTVIFYKYEIPRSSLPTMIHTILYRNAGVLAVCVTFIECFQNPTGRIRKLLASKPMTSLGKLSFSVYVLHMPLGRVILTWWEPMLEMELPDLVWMVPFFVGVYLAAVVVYFVLEQPASLLLKHYLVNKRKSLSGT